MGHGVLRLHRWGLPVGGASFAIWHLLTSMISMHSNPDIFRLRFSFSLGLGTSRNHAALLLALLLARWRLLTACPRICPTAQHSQKQMPPLVQTVRLQTQRVIYAELEAGSGPSFQGPQ